MMPLEGEAFFTSQMKDIPGRFMAWKNRSPPALPASLQRAFSSCRLCFSWSAATRCLAWAAS